MGEKGIIRGAASVAKCSIKTQLYWHPSLVCSDQSHAGLQVNLWFLLQSMEILALLSKERLSCLVKDRLLLILSEQLSVFCFYLTQAKLPAPSGAWPLEWGGGWRKMGALVCFGAEGRKIISVPSCFFRWGLKQSEPFLSPETVHL